MDTFYLGHGSVQWLAELQVPMFISRRAMMRRDLPKAVAPWALDSGGYTELDLYGGWHRVTPKQYVEDVRRFRDEIGLMQWAAPQDWMTPPHLLVKTGKTLKDHQRLTVENYLELMALGPELPFIPMLQGWDPGEYVDHAGQYDKAGVDLRSQTLVGVGSVVTRQGGDIAKEIFWRLHQLGLRMHGFGVKRAGVVKYGHLLTSADSSAWSFRARKENLRLAECRHSDPTCTGCATWALKWYHHVVTGETGNVQDAFLTDLVDVDEWPESFPPAVYPRGYQVPMELKEHWMR